MERSLTGHSTESATRFTRAPDSSPLPTGAASSVRVFDPNTFCASVQVIVADETSGDG